ncbi:MAG: hypothetical protein IJT61_04000 [Bacteroidales bacterium]|nr:hypothetical protein [Bacteroidales bacterium]
MIDITTSHKVREFDVMVRAFIDTVTLPEAESVHARLKSDSRTIWLSPVLDSETDNGYTINFDMKVPCRYLDDGWTSSQYAYDNWCDFADSDLPEGAEIYDNYIM